MIHKLAQIPVTTTLDQVIERLRLEEAEDIETASGLFERAKGIARPKALYREAYVEEISGDIVVIDGRRFESKVLAMALRGIHRVFAYVATCGVEVDEWSRSEGDYIVSIWLDMIKQMFLRDANAFLREHLHSVFGLEKLSSVNPGSGNAENWPIAQQVTLFDLIGDVGGEIGVTLTQSFLMTPVKSNSGLLFPTEIEFVNCALCGRENCPGRRAPFDAALYAQAFAG